MNDALSLNYTDLNVKVKNNKKAIIKILEKKSEDARLELIKEAFKNNNLVFDDNITSYQEFIKYVNKNFKNRDLSLANNIIDKINKEIDKLILDLKNGSMTSFTDFLNKVNKVVGPISNSLVDSLAVRTILTLTPTAFGKVGVGVILTGINLYNLHKIDKYKRVTNKTYELNRILEELEATKDNNGNYIDTRFNETIRKSIIDFLNTNGIIFENTGYLSIREAIYNLNDEKKEELCIIINNLKGANIDIENRLKDVNQGLFKRFGNKYLKDVSIGAATGISVATTINGVAPTAIPALLNGTVLGNIVNNLANSKVLGWATGVLSSIGTFLGNFVPALAKIFAMENLALFAVGGAGIGLLSAIGKKLYSIIKKRKDRFKASSDMKKLQELDNKLYAEIDKEEIKVLTEKLSKENENTEKVIINIICEYMDELGINYEKRPATFEELEKLVKSLSNKDKDKIYDLMTSLEDYAKRDPNDFKREIKKIGGYLKTALTIGLAGLSIVDLISAGAFLSNLKSKIFKGDSAMLPNQPERIKQFDDSEGILAYEEKQKALEASKVEVKASEHVPVPSTYEAHKTPSPQATPGPSENVTTISKTTNDVTTTIESNITSRNINMAISEYSNKGEVIEIFSNYSDSKLYNTLSNVMDPRMADRALTVLTENDLERLQVYMETSADINRNSLGYRFLKEAFERKINVQNSVIDKTINTFQKKVAIENSVDKVTKGVIAPLTAITSYEKTKKR